MANVVPFPPYEPARPFDISWHRANHFADYDVVYSESYRPNLSIGENRANKWGSYPIVGSFVGVGRIFYGFGQIVYSLYDPSCFKKGLLNVGRGVIETASLITGIACRIYDSHMRFYEGSIGSLKEKRIQRLFAQGINHIAAVSFIVGSLIGIARIIYGIVKILFVAPFTRKFFHIKEGGYHIARGIIEALPFTGYFCKRYEGSLNDQRVANALLEENIRMRVLLLGQYPSSDIIERMEKKIKKSPFPGDIWWTDVHSMYPGSLFHTRNSRRLVELGVTQRKLYGHISNRLPLSPAKRNAILQTYPVPENPTPLPNNFHLSPGHMAQIESGRYYINWHEIENISDQPVVFQLRPGFEAIPLLPPDAEYQQVPGTLTSAISSLIKPLKETLSEELHEILKEQEALFDHLAYANLGKLLIFALIATPSDVNTHKVFSSLQLVHANNGGALEVVVPFQERIATLTNRYNLLTPEQKIGLQKSLVEVEEGVFVPSQDLPADQIPAIQNLWKGIRHLYMDLEYANRNTNPSLYKCLLPAPV